MWLSATWSAENCVVSVEISANRNDCLLHMPQSFHMHYFEFELKIHNSWVLNISNAQQKRNVLQIVWCPMKQNLQLKSMSETQLAHTRISEAIEATIGTSDENANSE